MHSARLTAPASEAAAAAVPAHLSPISYADLKVGAKWAMPTELAPPPNKFHEGPSGASRMQENLLAAGTRLGAYSAPPDLVAGHSPTTRLLLSGPPLFGPMALAHLARP